MRFMRESEVPPASPRQFFKLMGLREIFWAAAAIVILPVALLIVLSAIAVGYLPADGDHLLDVP